VAQQHDRSVAQEQRIAKRVGGKLTGRSGAGWLRKADVREERFLFEMKRTDNKRSITILADDLEVSRKHAIRADRTMAFGIELNGRNYIIMAEDDWLEEVGLE
jgi:hypothetical protein